MLLIATPNVGTALTLVNENVDTGYKLVESDWGNAVWETVYSGQRGTQGARPAGGEPKERPVVLGLRAYGTSKDNLNDRLAALNLLGDRLRRYGGLLTAKSAGQTYRQHFDVMAGTAAVREWSRSAEVNWRALTTLEAVCAPYLRGDSFDIIDDFAANSIADYTFDEGNGTLSVSGGQLVPSSTGNKRARHTARGYQYGDVQVTIKVTPTTAANQTVYVSLAANGSSANLKLGFSGGYVTINRHGGADVASNFPTVTAPPANQPFWIRGRKEGNVVTAEYWTTEPTPMGTPAITVTGTLSVSDAATYATGGVGFEWAPVNTADRIDDYRVEPLTYRNRTLPELIRLSAPIPGDAPALADVTVTPSGGSAAPIWALLGWSERAPSHSPLWNGDLEENIEGWANTAPSGLNAGSTISHQTGAAKYGNGYLQVVSTSASAFQGAAFRVYGKFKKGRTYKIALWAKSPSATNALQLLIVSDSTEAGSTTNTAALTTAWQEMIGADYTPTADRNWVDVIVRTATAVAITWHVDAVRIYETAPTLGRHVEGAGAVPPFGVIEAESADPGDISASWAITTDANSHGGLKVADSSVSGAETYTAGWWVDPHLLVADDFTQCEVDIEVFAAFELDSALVSPIARLSARPEWGTNFGAERFTSEYGQTGKALVKPSSSTGIDRMSRLGTLTLPVDRSRPSRWKLYLTLTTAVGSTGAVALDYLVAVLVRARAASPTGKPNDSSYPKFVASTAETSKTILSDLRGLVAKPPYAPAPDHGLGQALLELPPGDVDLLVKLSNLVPDDPTSDTSDEQVTQSATVHVAVTPRWHLFRGT